MCCKWIISPLLQLRFEVVFDAVLATVHIVGVVMLKHLLLKLGRVMPLNLAITLGDLTPLEELSRLLLLIDQQLLAALVFKVLLFAVGVEDDQHLALMRVLSISRTLATHLHGYLLGPRLRHLRVTIATSHHRYDLLLLLLIL